MDLCQKKSRNFYRDEETAGQGDYWIWTAVALPSRLRVTSYLSQERSEAAAQAFIRQFKARTDGQAPFFTSDKLPAYVAALVRHYPSLKTIVHTVWNRIESQRVTHGSFDACI